MNKEVLAIHQDSLFVAGERVSKQEDGGQTWFRPLENGDVAVVLYNSNNNTAVDIKFTFDQVGWSSSDSASVRDLWEKQDLGTFVGGYSSSVKINDALLLRLSKQA